MTRIIAIIEMEVPPEVKGLELSNYVTRAFDKTRHTNVKLINKQFVRKENWEEHLLSLPRPAAPRLKKQESET